MKKKIFFGLLGLLVCMFTMTACSSDDDNNNGGGTTSGLKLTAVDWGDTDAYLFTYDTQGRLKTSTYYAPGHSPHHIDTYAYLDDKNKIVVTEKSNFSKDLYDYQYEYTLKDGLIVEMKKTDYNGEISCKGSYTYDNDRQLIGLKADWGNFQYSTTINWKDGNIESYAGGKLYGKYTCQYTSEPAERGLVLSEYGMYIFESNSEEMLFKMGYFGKQPKNLLASVQGTSESKNENYTFSYQFEGKNGYVSERTVIMKKGETTRTYTAKFTWE